MTINESPGKSTLVIMTNIFSSIPSKTLCLSLLSKRLRVSSPTSWSSCWRLELTRPSKTWRARSRRRSLTPVPSPLSSASTRLQKAKPLTEPPPVSRSDLIYSFSLLAIFSAALKRPCSTSVHCYNLGWTSLKRWCFQICLKILV